MTAYVMHFETVVLKSQYTVCSRRMLFHKSAFKFNYYPLTVDGLYQKAMNPISKIYYQ